MSKLVGDLRQIGIGTNVTFILPSGKEVKATLRGFPIHNGSEFEVRVRIYRKKRDQRLKLNEKVKAVRKGWE